MALLRLNDEGRLCLKGAVENQVPERPLIKDVLLLIDTSGSMTGNKLSQAKNKLEQQNILTERKIEGMNRTAILKYQMHKWCFILGLMSLIVSRAISHLLKVGVIK